MRTFIIGFNRTGTRSLDAFFASNGQSSVHWDQGRIARKIKNNYKNNLPLLKDYPDINVFGDIEDYKRLNYAHMDYFKDLYNQYPDSKFILNTRDMETWIKSRNHHLKGYYVIELCKILGIDREEINRRWRKDYADHHKSVTEFFKDKPGSMVIFDIEKDNIQKIVEFIPEYRLDPKYYSHIGKTDYKEQITIK